MSMLGQPSAATSVQLVVLLALVMPNPETEPAISSQIASRPLHEITSRCAQLDCAGNMDLCCSADRASTPMTLDSSRTGIPRILICSTHGGRAPSPPSQSSESSIAQGQRGTRAWPSPWCEAKLGCSICICWSCQTR